MAVATVSAVVMLLVLLLSIGFSRWKSSQSLNTPLDLVQRTFVPVRKDGVIFISDGAKGSSREAAIELAKHGFHVLVGCKTEAEIRSFAFDSRKGMEMIKFDVSSPETYIPLIYRLRQIERDLDRHIVGVVLNLAGMHTTFVCPTSPQVLTSNVENRLLYLHTTIYAILNRLH